MQEHIDFALWIFRRVSAGVPSNVVHEFRKNSAWCPSQLRIETSRTKYIKPGWGITIQLYRFFFAWNHLKVQSCTNCERYGHKRHQPRLAPRFYYTTRQHQTANKKL